MGPSGMAEFYAPLWCVRHHREVTAISRRRAHCALACARRIKTSGVLAMTPDGMLESIAGSYVQTSSTDPARRVDRAMDMLRAHLLERTVGNDWNEEHAHEVARAIVTCLRESKDLPAEDRQSRPP